MSTPSNLRTTLTQHSGWVATMLTLVVAFVLTTGSSPVLAFWSWPGASAALLLLVAAALVLSHSRSEPGGLADSRHTQPGRQVLPGGAHSLAATPESVPDGDQSGFADRFLRGSTGMLLPTAPRQHAAPDAPRAPLRQALIPLGVALVMLLVALLR